jgi:hypothetical protein
MKKIIGLLLVITMFSCTSNERAKHWGGTMKIELDRGQKLVDVTWKESSLWYMTRDMKDGETADTYTFKEDAPFGIVEGKVIFIESK